MGLKKYEIITVGSDKRVRALRSWAVGDRYVNIGDVGGIVYDEKTLSQDGACWLFRGNFGFPGARIGGDSIVDVGEAALSATGAPNVDILGSSVVVGSKLQFKVDQTAEDTIVLTADDFEQGLLTFAAGVNWETWKTVSVNHIRSKAPIFMGGVSKIIKLAVPGYTVQAYVLDRDGKGVTATASANTGEGVTLAIPAGQYFVLRMTKNPVGPTVPTDATAAQITFTGTYETKLSIVDSRLEINPANSTGVTIIKPGGSYSIVSGAKYPEAVIRNSKVSLRVSNTEVRVCRMMGQFIGSTAMIDATASDVTIAGIYSNVKNLTASGVLPATANVSAYGIIQVNDCDNFSVSPTNFPGLATIQTAGVPIRFYNCNLNNGRFYHHAQIANTYRDIDFDLATADLDKAFSTDRTLGSSEVNGMYRTIFNGTPGPLVESYESVKNMVISQNKEMYNTTIYADAYFNGAFDIRGTNVFGNTKRHDTQDVSGCKIVNTGETAVPMKGNIRVEGNATLTNCSIIGSGYFGGKAIASGLLIEGSVFMSDNASFTKTAGVGVIGNLKMKDNATAVVGDVPILGNIALYDNSVFKPSSFGNAEADVSMHDNATVTSSLSLGGKLTMRDDATVSAGQLLAVGDITLCGSYKQTATRSWTGKRVIFTETEPTYDNNVKTQYDF